MELQQGNQDWEEVVKQFMHTFAFDNEQPVVDVALQMIKEKIFVEIHDEVVNSHQCSATMLQWMACCNMSGELDNDPTNLNIPELDGVHEVEGSGFSSEQFFNLFKTKKVNIFLLENTKFANIGDYWDEEIVAKITYLLHEFQDMLPSNFSEMKGIVGDLGEMKIPLKPDAKPVKQQPYRLNPRYEEKVKAELDRMLDA